MTSKILGTLNLGIVGFHVGQSCVKRVELIGQYHDTPGCYRSPDIAVISSCSEEVKIKGNTGRAVVDCFVQTCGWDGCHGLSGGRAPYDSSATPRGRFHGALWVAVTGVAVGEASGPSNESALAHRRLLLEDRDAV